MSLTIGQVLSGARWGYCITEPLTGDGSHAALVYKARVSPGSTTSVNEQDMPEWAVIKCPSPLRAQRDFTRLDLKREWEAYQHPSIANSPYIRKLYDLIGNPEDFDDKTGETRPCLALEWMDMTLQDLTPKLDKRAYKLIVAIIEAVMESILCFSEAKVVDTDTKPGNFLLSNIDTDHPTVKIGDLGLVLPCTHPRTNVQPLPMRAPEVFLGFPCTTKSQVWSCAASLLFWLKPSLLGSSSDDGDGLRGSCIDVLPTPWCLAKLRRLFPAWRDRPVAGDVRRKAEWALSEDHLEELPAPLKRIGCLEEEMGRLGMVRELRGVMGLMLVTDPKERFGPREVLASGEMRALREVVSTGGMDLDEE
ncbi:kinase-like protein [Canariomyces notabilis]|uniref:Kinase-like protein n=1 Tax=Canariomyces notabilis TaxID=2074819 RepID=A0AAN6QEQ0_9PEZI|nr:kinase-like protein [Canariomyces arenarius]